MKCPIIKSTVWIEGEVWKRGFDFSCLSNCLSIWNINSTSLAFIHISSICWLMLHNEIRYLSSDDRITKLFMALSHGNLGTHREKARRLQTRAFHLCFTFSQYFDLMLAGVKLNLGSILHTAPPSQLSLFDNAFPLLYLLPKWMTTEIAFRGDISTCVQDMSGNFIYFIYFYFLRLLTKVFRF